MFVYVCVHEIGRAHRRMLSNVIHDFRKRRKIKLIYYVAVNRDRYSRVIRCIFFQYYLYIHTYIVVVVVVLFHPPNLFNRTSLVHVTERADDDRTGGRKSRDEFHSERCTLLLTTYSTRTRSCCRRVVE